MLCFRFQHCIFWTLTFSMISNARCSIDKDRIKRAPEDNFGVLLNLYKINPLGESKVFKTFANRILLSNRGGASAMHFNANESSENQRRTTQNLKHIENVIHARSPPTNRNDIRQPEYVVEDTVPENFNAKILAKIDSKPSDEVDLGHFFGHIGESFETTDNTKSSTGLETTLDAEVILSMENNDISYKVRSDDEVLVMK